jgi:PAS domain S-box-containing protein
MKIPPVDVHKETLDNLRNCLSVIDDSLNAAAREGQPAGGEIAAVRTALARAYGILDEAAHNSPDNHVISRDRLLASFVDDISDGLLGLNRDWRFIYANLKAARNVGYEPYQLVGKNIWETFPSLLGTDHETYYRQVMEQRQFAHFETKGVLTEQSYDIRIYPSSEGIVVYWLDITQRKQVEDQLRMQANILAALNDAVIVADLSYHITAWMGGAERIYGWKEQEVLGKVVKDVLRSELSPEQRAVLYKGLEDGLPVVKELIQFTKDDRKLVISGYTLPLRNSSGEVIGFTSINQDITQQKQIETRLIESERKNRELVKYAPAAIYEIDFLSRRFLSVNDAMCVMSGFSRDELLQMDATTLLEEDSRRLFLQRILLAQAGGKLVENVEYKVRAKDGHEIFALLNTTFKTDENGRITSATVIGHDITQRKRAEITLQQANAKLQMQTEELAVQAEELHSQADELRTANEKLKENDLRLKGFYESTHDYFLSLDQDWTITHTNSGFAKIMGFTPQSLIGSNFWQIFPKLLNTSAQKNYYRAMEEQTPVHFEMKGMYTPFWYAVSVYPAKNGVSVFITDRTEEHKAREALRTANSLLEQRVMERTQELQAANEELKSTEEELRSQYEVLEKTLAREKSLRNQLIQSEKFAALARLVGSVAHEINNPLQNVKNCLFLLRTETEPENCAEIIDMATAETKRMAELVVQLRQTYRPSNPQPVDFNLADVLARVSALLGPQFKQNNVAWQVDSPPDCIILHGIPDQIQQVFINICLNAVEAMGPRGGRLDLSISLPMGQKAVYLSFHDTGPGIPQQHLSQIFEPFFTTKDKGTGLGLAICYEIIKSHGGEIAVDSQPGKGATFTVSLPLQN